MIHSKLLPIPEFSPLPKTDAADVPENINIWLDTKREGQIKNFLRRCPRGHRGYRFANSEDFTETKSYTTKIIGVEIEVAFTRRARAKDHFYPLCFTIWWGGSFAEVHIKGTDEKFIFKSDNDLKTRLRAFKKSNVVAHKQSNMNSEKTYIGTYKVTKYFRVSGRRQVLAKGLTREEAMRIVRRHPNSNNWLVGFDKEFTADKYYIQK